MWSWTLFCHRKRLQGIFNRGYFRITPFQSLHKRRNVSQGCHLESEALWLKTCWDDNFWYLIFPRLNVWNIGWMMKRRSLSPCRSRNCCSWPRHTGGPPGSSTSSSPRTERSCSPRRCSCPARPAYCWWPPHTVGRGRKSVFTSLLSLCQPSGLYLQRLRVTNWT